MVTVQFLGSGDAFGSGGRFLACISVRSASTAAGLGHRVAGVCAAAS